MVELTVYKYIQYIYIMYSFVVFKYNINFVTLLCFTFLLKLCAL